MADVINRIDVIDTLKKAKHDIKRIEHPIGDVLKQWQETVIDSLIDEINGIPETKRQLFRGCVNCKYAIKDFNTWYCRNDNSLYNNEPVDINECICEAWISEDE